MGLLSDGEPVCLEYDPTAPAGPQGHPLIDLFRAADGLFVNQAMIVRGYAGLGDPLGPRAGRLRAAYGRARQAGPGLWARGRLALAPSPPSAEFVRVVAQEVRRRARWERRLRDLDAGVFDAFDAGRRAGAFEAGYRSALQASALEGNRAGFGKVFVKNPTDVAVRVTLDSGTFSDDLVVPARDRRALGLPFGTYEVTFQPVGGADGPFRGDPVTLSGPPVELSVGRDEGGGDGRAAAAGNDRERAGGKDR